MIRRLRDRLVAADPGAIRLLLALSAITGIAITVAALSPFGFPLPVLLVGAVGAMMSAFTVDGDTRGEEATTLGLALLAGATSLAAASLGSALPPLDSVVFVLLIFVAVYSQRFGGRGIALGSFTFFLFFFAMFLQTKLAQVPVLVLSLTVGLAANAVVRFLVLPRRKPAEFRRIRRSFRARMGQLVHACEQYLDSGGGARTRRRLDRLTDRLHDCVLLIDDAGEDVLGAADVDRLRRRAIEVELAAGWLVRTVQRTCAEELPPAVRADLVAALHRFRLLIERDPDDLPLISRTGEFSRMLVAGSRIRRHAEPGDELRHAIAELALADARAQRLVEQDGPAEPDDDPAENAANPTENTEEPEKFFAWDNQTRSALQAVVGGGLAVLGGELVSNQRWYWAVLTVFVVFVGAGTAGATLVKGTRRVLGTLIGILGGVLLALLVAGNPVLTVALIGVCVFGMVYMARASQLLMAVFITSMLGLLYSLLGTFSIEVLWIRLAETAVGAAAGVLSAVLVLPVHTRSVLLDDLAEVLADLRAFLDRGAEMLAGRENVNVIELARDLDHSVAQAKSSTEPLTHPISVSRARRGYGTHLVATLETIAGRARHVAARAQPGMLSEHAERLAAYRDRVLGNIDTLLELTRAPGTGRGTLTTSSDAPASDREDDPLVRSVTSSLDRLDTEVIALGTALGCAAVPARAPAAG